MSIEGFKRLLGIFQMQQADSKAELGFGISRRDLQRLAEVGGGLVPASQLLQADCQLEIAGAMVRLDFDQLGISFYGFLIPLQLVQNVAHGGVQGRLTFAALHRLAQLAQRLLCFSFQVQRYCCGQRPRTACFVVGIRRSISCF